MCSYRVGGAASLSMALYTEKRGWFSKRELAKLASALGFPTDIFFKELSKSTDSVLRSEYTRLEAGKSIAERNIRRMLESGALNYRLEEVFNKHDAQYNVKIILKTVSLLHHRQLSYREIAEGRLAFELYSVEDGSGLPAEAEPVAQALKLMERVMAPSRLEAEIQKQQHYCDLTSRIRLHEFYELVVKCSKSMDAAKQMDYENKESLPDISKMLTPTDQQVLDHLEERYKATLVKRVEPSPVAADGKRAVSMAPRRILRSLSKEHSWALVPPLERSQQQLHQARNGTAVFSSDQYAVVESYSRPNTSLSMGSYKSRKVQSRRKQQLRVGQLPQIIDDSVIVSKSAPNILLGISEQDGEAIHDLVDEDLTDTISKICLGSVERARDALSQSLAFLPQNAHVSTSTLPVLCEDSGTTKNCKASPSLGHGGVALTAIVTKEDILRHQDRMSELEWERLTKYN